jgi:hypothetical protein
VSPYSWPGEGDGRGEEDAAGAADRYIGVYRRRGSDPRIGLRLRCEARRRRRRSCQRRRRSSAGLSMPTVS